MATLLTLATLGDVTENRTKPICVGSAKASRDGNIAAMYVNEIEQFKFII
jgi:hypothetical protein